MTRRFVAILAIVCLALLTAAPATLAVQEPCLAGDSPGVEYQGTVNSSPTAARSGVKATFDLDSGFDLCTNPSGPSNDGFIRAFISIRPRGGTDPTQLIEIGVVECRVPIYSKAIGSNSYCYGENAPQLYWAWGGCFPYTPGWRHLFATDYNPHTIQLYRDDDGYWHLWYGGTQVATLADNLVNCWTGGNTEATWAYMGYDTGDSLGDSGSKFDNMQYGRFGLGWFDPLLPSPYPHTCSTNQAPHFCQYTDHDSIRVWTN